MFGSLRLRIALSHAGVLLGILLLLGGGGALLLARNLDRSATSDLESAAAGQARRIEEAGHAVPPPDADSPSQAATQLGVFLPDGAPIGEPSELPEWVRPNAQPVVDRTVSGEPVRIVTTHATVDGGSVATVVAGRSLVPERSLLHRVRLLLLSGSLVAAVLALFAGWWLAGRAVRPVERAYRAQAEFAADASHEFRTPLTFIRSGVETLARHEPALGREVLGEIDYLTGLTRRMLALARSHDEAMALAREPVDLGEVCRSAVRRASVDGVRAQTVGNGAAQALGDRVATEAALDAVLENVRVHGGGTATVSWSADGGHALVSVADRGPGLDPSLREAVFGRFHRGDASRARETGGAGLGLALSRRLVEAQGGSIWLEETPGGGLTAKLSLPSATGHSG
ncbi:MAG: sensor histidine kinase [Actinomycetota bacterium]